MPAIVPVSSAVRKSRWARHFVKQYLCCNFFFLFPGMAWLMCAVRFHPWGFTYLPSALWRHCVCIRSEVGHCSAVSELHGSSLHAHNDVMCWNCSTDVCSKVSPVGIYLPSECCYQARDFSLQATSCHVACSMRSCPACICSSNEWIRNSLQLLFFCPCSINQT